MSQRDSGYERKERDCYETPEWVTDVIGRNLAGSQQTIWEPAAGSGKMAAALRKFGLTIHESDIVNGVNFLTESEGRGCDGIITNPPYDLACGFIEHALELMRPGGFVAMLLRTDFDHAKTRQHLFSKCRQFKLKIVLTKRIRWFEGTTGSPSFNHAWFVWDWKHEGPPTLAYH